MAGPNRNMQVKYLKSRRQAMEWGARQSGKYEPQPSDLCASVCEAARNHKATHIAGVPIRHIPERGARSFF